MVGSMMVDMVRILSSNLILVISPEDPIIPRNAGIA